MIARRFLLAAFACGIADGAPVFTRDLAPILYEHCAECHRPGEFASFSVLRYADVAGDLPCGDNALHAALEGRRREILFASERSLADACDSVCNASTEPSGSPRIE